MTGVKQYIKIDGQRIERGEAEAMPENSILKDAWVLDGKAIVVDVEKAKSIYVKAVREWHDTQMSGIVEIPNVGSFQLSADFIRDVQALYSRAVRAEEKGTELSRTIDTFEGLAVTLDVAGIIAFSEALEDKQEDLKTAVRSLIAAINNPKADTLEKLEIIIAEIGLSLDE